MTSSRVETPFQTATAERASHIAVNGKAQTRDRSKMMRLRDRSFWTGVVVAVVAVVVATWLRMALSAVLSETTPFITFFLAVMVAAWFGGFWPALFAIGLSALAACYFFIPPLHSFQIVGSSYLVSLVVFVMVNSVIAVLAESQRASRRRAELALQLLNQQQGELAQQRNARVQAEEAVRLQNEELQTTVEELEVTEEELRTHNEELVSTRQAIELERRRYLELFEFAPDGYIISDSKGVIREANRAASNMFGVAQAALVGEPLNGFVHVNCRESLRALLESVGNQGHRVEHCDLRLQPIDSAPFDGVATIARLPSRDGQDAGFQWLIRDVTESRQALEALRRSEQELNDFFENAAIGIHWVGPDGMILRANQAELDMLGYAAEDYVGHHIGEFHVDQAVIEDILARLGAAETVKDYEVRLRCRDGSIKYALIDSNVLWENQELIHSRCFTRDITDRRQAEQSLRASEQHLQMALRAGRMGAWEWHLPSGKVTWSPGMEIIHGIGPGGFGGQFEDFQRTVHPDDREAMTAAISMALHGHPDYHAEYRIIRPDGQLAWVEARGSVQRDGNGQAVQMNGVCIDITEHKRTEESLRNSEAQYRASFELAAVGKAQTDADSGRFIRVNRKLCEIAGYSEQELLSMTFSQITHPEDREGDYLDWRRMVAGEIKEHSVEKRYIGKNGEITWVNVTGTVVRDAEGRPLRGISVIQDVSARKKAEAELDMHRERLEEVVAQRTQQLQESHQKLRISERMAALGTLSAGLGHDMGNLLLPLRLRLDSMEAKATTSENREDLEAIRKCAEYLQRLANGLRLFALDPEANEAAADRTDLNEWWPDVFSFFKNALPRYVTLECRFAAELPPVRLARPNLTQAVFNLIQNAGDALKGRESGEVVVWAEPGVDKHTIRIGVSDDGPGMTREIRQRCLEPFFTTKTRAISTGLGLALVHGIVQKVGGIVEIHSELGRGSTFVLVLPAGSDSDVEAAIKSQRPLAIISLQDERIRAYVISVLQAMSFNVLSADLPDQSEAMLWLTEPSEGVLERAQAFMNGHAGRRVMIFGKVSENGPALNNGILEFGEAPKPAAIRQLLREMALDFSSNEPEERQQLAPQQTFHG